MSTHGLIVAAGRGHRAGEGVPKQYREVGGKPLLRHAVEGLRGVVDAVVVVIHPDDADLYATAVAGLDVLPWEAGGATRQESVRLGLESIGTAAPARVLIHDAARAFMPAEAMHRVLAALDEGPGACPALPVTDSLRSGGDHVEAEVAREGLYRVQTPQGFDYAAIRAAHANTHAGCTDDVAVARASGLRVALVAGDERGFKLTTPHDFQRAEAMIGGVSRSAQGYDVHRFGTGDHVWLCGVRIPHSHGLIGHSDADAGLHALTDALLGTIGAGDIGDHFPPSDARWRGASSDRFLLHAAGLIAARGGIIDHVDVTLICEAPKIGPQRAAMRARLADLLGIALDMVSVKATTAEGLGFTGRREGLAALAMATVRVPR